MKVFCVLSISIVFSTTCAQAKYPWTVELQVSRDQSEDFLGELQLHVTFDNFSSDTINLPIERYVAGEIRENKILLNTDRKIIDVYAITSTFCINMLPNANKLRLVWLKFTSFTTGVSYMKHSTTNDFTINDKCTSVYGTMLFEFKEIPANSCAINDKVYEDGQQFNLECLARCQCSNGSVSCISMCPPMFLQSVDNVTCKELFKEGQCCATPQCVDENGMVDRGTDKQVSKCSENIKIDNPSLVAFNDSTENLMNIGVLLSEKFAIASTPRSFPTVLQYTKEGKILSHDVTNTSTLESARLVLMKIADYFPYSLQPQMANLPITQKHCEILIGQNCTKFGFAKSSINLSHMIQFKGHACEPYGNVIKCSASGKDSCIKDTAALFANENGYNFLIGFKENDRISTCTSSIVFKSLCPYLQWINMELMSA